MVIMQLEEKEAYWRERERDREGGGWRDGGRGGGGEEKGGNMDFSVAEAVMFIFSAFVLSRKRHCYVFSCSVDLEYFYIILKMHPCIRCNSLHRTKLNLKGWC
jgi:hypothetical protein